MATLDVVSYDRARQSRNIGPVDTSKKPLFESVISAVSQRMDELCGPIVQRTITEIVEVDRPMTSIRLATGPVSSITSVTVYVTGDDTTLTAETLTTAGGYLPEFENRIRPDGTSQLLSGVLRRRLAFGDSWWDWPSRVRVVYVAGRYANTAAAVDSRFEQAALIAIASMWRTYGQQVDLNAGEYATPFQSFPSVDIPAAALSLVAADRVHVAGIA